MVQDTVKVQTGSQLGNVEIVTLKSDSVTFDLSLDKEYLITAGKVALYNGNNKLGYITLDSATIKAASQSDYRMTLAFKKTEVTNGDRLYLRFEDVVFNGREFTIPTQESITYTN